MLSRPTALRSTEYLVGFSLEELNPAAPRPSFTGGRIDTFWYLEVLVVLLERKKPAKVSTTWSLKRPRRAPYSVPALYLVRGRQPEAGLAGDLGLRTIDERDVKSLGVTRGRASRRRGGRGGKQACKSSIILASICLALEYGREVAKK